ncbi:hypothetical protein ACI784_15220 [Geodermatophilus sp. SYSU D01186]
MDLLQVWLALAGVAVVLIVGVLFTAARLWGDVPAVDDDEAASVAAD